MRADTSEFSGVHRLCKPELFTSFGASSLRYLLRVLSYGFSLTHSRPALFLIRVDCRSRLLAGGVPADMGDSVHNLLVLHVSRC